MRVAILCNDRVAIPAIESLLPTGLLVAVGMPDRIYETHLLVQSRCAHFNIPLQTFSKQGFAGSIAAWLDLHKPDVVLVKTFPFLIPETVLPAPRHGFINFHYAPLPHWRGANPLFWMLKQGVQDGGITVHRMSAAFDEGPVLLQQPVACGPDVNFGLYYTQLAYAGAQLTPVLLNGLQQGNLPEQPQTIQGGRFWNRPKAEDLQIDWQRMTAGEIHNLVRACTPWNKGAATRWNGWTFGLTHVVIEPGAANVHSPPGTVESISRETGFRITTRDGLLLSAEVVYCEEGYYPGYWLSRFGIRPGETLT